ncbi:MAG: tetratricopeptide repeat protein [Nannocystaceae bacterium]
MDNARLWPLVIALGVLLAGTAATEVIARSSEGRVLSWEIRGDDAVVALDDEDSEGDGAEAWYAAEALSEEHAQARLLARRGDYEAALTTFAAVVDGAPASAPLRAEYGHWLRRAGRHDEAAAALERALALDPGSAQAHLDRAHLALARGDREAALQGFAEALRLRPLHTSTRIAYGRLLLDLGRAGEAIAILEPATTSGGNDRRARALAALGRAYAADGQVDAAREAFDGAVQRAPAVASLWAQAALGLGKLDDPEAIADGLRYAQQAARLAPDSAYAQDVLGRALERAQLESDAFDAYTRALKLDGGLRHPRSRLARMAIEREDWTTARRSAQSLLALDPERAEAHFLAGLVELKAGRYDDARARFDGAIAAADGDYAEAWYNLGLLERKVGEHEAAIAAYERALSQRPRYLAAINNLGLVYSDLGRHDDAEAQFRRAIGVKASYAGAWTNLARSQAARGRYAEAAASYREALALTPDARSARLQLAVNLRKAGDADGAIREYRGLLDANPRYVKAWFNLGIALVAEDRADEAVDAYEAALRHDREHFGAHKNLGLLLVREGRPAQARPHLEAAVEAKPADVELRLALATLDLADGRADACLRDVDGVLRQEPTNARALSLRTQCQGNNPTE